MVIPGCLVAALLSAFLQLEALHRVQQAIAAGTLDTLASPTHALENDKSNVSYREACDHVSTSLSSCDVLHLTRL